MLLVGCGTMSGEGAMGLPQQFEGEVYPGPRFEITGQVLVAANGCAHLEDPEGVERLVIWPRGSTLSAPARLSDGTELLDGDRVTGSGTVIAMDALPGGADGYWANVTGYCTGDVPEVVIFDEVRPTD